MMVESLERSFEPPQVVECGGKQSATPLSNDIGHGILSYPFDVYLPSKGGIGHVSAGVEMNRKHRTMNIER